MFGASVLAAGTPCTVSAGSNAMVPAEVEARIVAD